MDGAADPCLGAVQADPDLDQRFRVIRLDEFGRAAVERRDTAFRDGLCASVVADPSATWALV